MLEIYKSHWKYKDSLKVEGVMWQVMITTSRPNKAGLGVAYVQNYKLNSVNNKLT